MYWKNPFNQPIHTGDVASTSITVMFYENNLFMLKYFQVLGYKAALLCSLFSSKHNRYFWPS